MKIPRDISAEKLIQSLGRLGYTVNRQKGSHIRLTSIINSGEYHITIPNHNPLKIGTLNNIVKDLAERYKTSKDEILTKLFGG